MLMMLADRGTSSVGSPAESTAMNAPLAVPASAPATTTYQAGTKPSAEQLAAWATQFHRDGYVFLRDVLPPERCAELRADFDRVRPVGGGATEHAERMFEHSRANLELFDLDPVISLAEVLLGEDNRYGAETVHVVHNNSFRTINGGGWSGWHQDDSSHFVVTGDGPAPTNIHLPVLLMTANYYLTDQEDVSNGPGQVIPGSHKFGRQLPSDLTGTAWEKQIVSCTGKAGSVMLFNCQVWHRGSPNRSERMRYVTQVSYGRKSIGHFFAPFMGYQMPEHCLEGADARRKRLLGFKVRGAYG